MLAIMDQSHARDGYHEDDFNANTWAMAAGGYNSPHLISPAQEYPAFTFNPGSMPLSGVYGTHVQSSPQGNFTPQWPSMLTNPSPTAGAPMQAPQQMAHMHTYAPPQPLPPLVTAPAPPAPQPQSTSRRTLTDHDRRRMCQYHEENPTVKQTEIGAMFGVERSTVSKVLRQKEKYLAQDDGSKSPIRRQKGKFPDIERALTNWAAKHQQKGLPLTDQAIREKARFFAASVGNPEASVKVNNPTWLEKFKQKNQIGSGKQRKGSSNIATEVISVDSQTSSGISPVSPARLQESPVTASPTERRAEAQIQSPAHRSVGGSRLGHSKSTTSLASGYSDSGSSFSASSSQPPMPAIYEQHMAHMSQQMQAQQQQQQQPQHAQIAMLHSSSPELVRPRSQTFPTVGPESMQPGLSQNMMEGQLEDIMSHAPLETPQDEYPGRSLSVASLSSSDLPHLQPSRSSMIDTPILEHSPSVMGPPMNHLQPVSATSSTVPSPIWPPTLDEGRRGLEVAVNYIETLPSGVIDAQEYSLLTKLQEKLRGLGGGPIGGEMPGGMHVLKVKKEMDKKRSIHSL